MPPASLSQPTTHYQQPSLLSPHQQNPFSNLTYFHSKEARNVFGYSLPKNDEDRNKDVRDIIYERMVKMRDGAFTFNGWKQLIEFGDFSDRCGARFSDQIKMKAKYIYHALAILLNEKEIQPALTWKKCCDLAIEKIKEFEGANLIENNIDEQSSHHWVVSRTVMKWFRHFRDNGETFINTPYRTSLIDKDPPIFQLNPILKDKFISFAKSNIIGLTGEVLFDYFHNTIIPDLIEDEKYETGEKISKDALLKQYGLTKLCLGTIYKWMASFGFKYCTSKKTYYVDGHEKPEVVIHRKAYCEQYLKDEIRCHRWI